MQSKSVLFLVIVAVLAGLSAFQMKIKPVSYGLDTRGGIRFIYKIDTAKLTSEQMARLPQIQNDLATILERRATGPASVAEPLIQKKGEDSFVIELPDMKDINAASETLSTTAKVVVYWAKTVNTQLYKTRSYERAGDKEYTVGKEGDKVSYVTFAKTVDPSKVIEPFASDSKSLTVNEDYKKVIDSWDKILEGDEVRDAHVQITGTTYKPEFFFNPSGAKKLEDWSRKYYNKGENIAFVLDNRVLQIAPLKDGAILSDEAIIDGTFSADYVKNLTELVKAGSLPVELIQLSSELVDPTIGKSALTQMEMAGVVSLVLVCIALIFYYRLPGIVATIAMALYALFTLAFLNVIGATFSLAAIAAFILSTGMAVDANILVFERLKEELRGGKALDKAVNVAFKRAFTAIFDSNFCTLMTCLVLYAFGTSAVKGFASTLGVGVLISFFTAFMATRSMLQVMLNAGIGKNPRNFGVGGGWFSKSREEEAGTKLLDIVGQSKKYFIISIALILPGFVMALMGGLKFNVEFTGGFEGTYMNPTGRTIAEIREGLEKAGFPGSNIKLADAAGKKVVYVTIPPVQGMSVSDPTAQKKVADAAGLSVEGSSFNKIGPSVRQETVTNAVNGIVLSSLLILVYLGIRFSVGGFKNGVKFGAAAVIALVHDVMFVIGSAAIVGMLMHWEISALFITAMLTVIGFSVHDTIIIFDRIRENLMHQQKGESFEHLCDKSVTQSVARSINTSFSAIIPLACLVAFGTPTPDLKFMCLSMLLGITIGAYSSIFNATPILYIWDKAVIKKRGEQAGLMASAAADIKARAEMAAAQAAGATMAGPAPAGGPQPAAGSAYGQVKRRSSAIEQSKRNIDEDEDA